MHQVSACDEGVTMTNSTDGKVTLPMAVPKAQMKPPIGVDAYSDSSHSYPISDQSRNTETAYNELPAITDYC